MLLMRMLLASSSKGSQTCLCYTAHTKNEVDQSTELRTLSGLHFVDPPTV